MTNLLVAPLLLYPHPPWVVAGLCDLFTAGGGRALAGGAGAPPPPITADCCGGLLVLGGCAPSTFFISRLAGDPIIPATKLPASTSDIWMMIMIL